MKQLSLFQKELKHIHLVAPDSPKKAFYRLWLLKNEEEYLIRKESGIFERKVLDKRLWVFNSMGKAEKYFDRTIQKKTDPKRISPRKYIKVFDKAGS